jgi:hypothetical protein
MKKISDRFRKILRKVFYGIGVSVISLILQACYGPMLESPAAYGMPYPPDDQDKSISGTVKAKETFMPILGIKVSIGEIDSYKLTDNNGNFEFIVPRRNYYSLIIEDIDGQDNGGLFKRQITVVSKDDINKPIYIYMDADTGTEEE